MRLSPLKHVLAVLRTTLGLTQKEMAGIAECSTPTIQAIELGKLKISDALASRIVFQTAVPSGWFQAGDPAKPIVDELGKPYTREDFERQQSDLRAPKATTDSHAAELITVWNIFHTNIKLLSAIYTHAFDEGKSVLVGYKVSMALSKLITQILKPEQMGPILEAMKDETGDIHHRHDDTQAVVTEFFQTTNDRFLKDVIIKAVPRFPKTGKKVPAKTKSSRRRR